MHNQFEKVILQSAKSLSSSIERTGYLNGGRDAPLNENNLLLHLASSLLKIDYGLYAQPALEAGKTRIDLVARGDDHCYAVEAKVVGDRNPERITKDADRLQTFSPQSSPRVDGIDESKYWEQSQNFGVLLVGSFAGPLYSDLWLSLSRPSFTTALGKYAAQRQKTSKKKWDELNNKLSVLGCHFGKQENVLAPNTWKDTSAFDLLWAIFEIPKVK